MYKIHQERMEILEGIDNDSIGVGLNE